MKAKYTIKTGKLGNEIYVEDPKTGGYTAYFKDFPSIISEGETIEIAQVNLWNTTYDILKSLIKH
jgi:hypothetical protein